MKPEEIIEKLIKDLPRLGDTDGDASEFILIHQDSLRRHLSKPEYRLAIAGEPSGNIHVRAGEHHHKIEDDNWRPVTMLQAIGGLQ